MCSCSSSLGVSRKKNLVGDCKTYKESFDRCANDLSEIFRFQNVRIRIEDALEHGKNIQMESQIDLNDDYSCGDHMKALSDEDADANLSRTRNVTQDANQLNDVKRKRL